MSLIKWVFMNKYIIERWWQELKHKIGWIIAVVLVFLMQLLFLHSMGTPILFDELDWLDISNDGAFVVFTFFGMFIVLISRMPSKATNWMSAGILLLFIAYTHDFLDEFWDLHYDEWWIELLEYFPFGLATLMVGLWLSKKEQIKINRHMRKREDIIRNLDLLDSTTGLLDFNYIKSLLNKNSFAKDKTLSIALLDISSFERLNHEVGFAAADEYLMALSELFLLSMNNNELLTRYAGEKFLFFIPNCTVTDANRRMNQIVTLQK
jgi:predicted signal transduction protein with EAL and GGDEF domain